MKTLKKQFPFKKPRFEALKTRLERSEALQVEAFIPALIFEKWSLRTGLSPEAGMGVSRTGLYTDFT